jgi:FkbH-like protein
MTADRLEAALAAYDGANDLRSLQAACREFAVAREAMAETPKGYYPRRIAVLANYTTSFLTLALSPALAQRQVWAEVFEGGFDQWEAALRDPAHALVPWNPDLVVVLLASAGLAVQRESDAAMVGARIRDAIASFRTRSAARVLLVLPEPLLEERSSAAPAHRWRTEIGRFLADAAPEGVTLIDPEPLVRAVGAERWYAPRYWITAKLPFHPDVTRAVADHLADVVRAHVSRRCKLAIVDADNTLWRGVIGDDGWEHVDLDAGGAGYPHLALQRFLKDLRGGGVLLALVSKNERGAVDDVFSGRREMILEPGDFADIDVSWDPKSIAVQRVLDRLNLSTSGVIFIDDSRFEREEIRASLPGIIVPELPADPAEWLASLSGSGLFELGPVSDEDRERTRFYDDERRRRSAKHSAGDYASFLGQLEMRLVPEDIGADRDRVVDLIGKTNQFNLTTRRHGWAAVQAMLDAGAVAFAYRFVDRYGDYGLISAVIAVPDGAGTYRIDTWVMSCRAMARTVEHAILQHLLEQLARRGARRLVGEYVPTGKNAPVAGLYGSLGFASDPGGSTSHLDIPSALDAGINRFVRIAEPAPSS